MVFKIEHNKKNHHLSDKAKSVASITLIVVLLLSTSTATIIYVNSNLAFAKKYDNNTGGSNTKVISRSLRNNANGSNPRIGADLQNDPRCLIFMFCVKTEGLNGETAGVGSAPDVSIAAGGVEVIQMTNFGGERLTYQGNLVDTFSLKDFFTPAGSSETLNPEQPKVMFDTSSPTECNAQDESACQRFYAIAIDPGSSSVRLAVSKSQSADGFVLFQPLTFDRPCMDDPTIGYSADKIAITVNLYNSVAVPTVAAKPNLAAKTSGPHSTQLTSQCDFTSRGFAGVQYYIIRKLPLISGREPTQQGPREIFKSNMTSSMFGLYAMQRLYTLTRGDTLYMAAHTGCVPVIESLVNKVIQDCTHIRVLSFGTEGQVTLSGTPNNIQDVPIQTTRLPPNADQPDTNVLIDTGDNRIRSGFQVEVGFGGAIVLAFNDQCNGFRTSLNDKGLKACFRIVQINLGTSDRVSQDYLVGDNFGHYFYPALTSSHDGVIGVTFGASRSGNSCIILAQHCFPLPISKMYPSLMEGRPTLSRINTFFPFFPLQLPFFLFQTPVFRGTVPAEDAQIDETNTSCHCFVNLYGEYFGAATYIDFTSRFNEIWLSGEFYTTPAWHTGIFTFPRR